MRRDIIRVLCLFVLLGVLPGCLQLRHSDGMKRFWIDYNTLQAPAIYLEELDHRPSRRGRVSYFRWMYNQNHPPENPPEQAAQSHSEAVLIFESLGGKPAMMNAPADKRMMTDPFKRNSAEDAAPFPDDIESPGIRHIPPPVPPVPLDDLDLQLPGTGRDLTPGTDGPSAQNESRIRPASFRRLAPERSAIMTPTATAPPTPTDRLRSTLKRNNGRWLFNH